MDLRMAAQIASTGTLSSAVSPLVGDIEAFSFPFSGHQSAFEHRLRSFGGNKRPERSYHIIKLRSLLNQDRLWGIFLNRLPGNWSYFFIVSDLSREPGQVIDLPLRMGSTVIKKLTYQIYPSIGPVKKEDRKASVYLALRYTLQVKILYLSMAFIIQA